MSWSHFVELIPLEETLKRDFYAELCRVERWSVRTLRQKIGHLLYERTALSKKPDDLIVQDLAALRDEDRMTPDLVFRDPYFLEFLLGHFRVDGDQLCSHVHQIDFRHPTPVTVQFLPEVA